MLNYLILSRVCAIQFKVTIIQSSKEPATGNSSLRNYHWQQYQPNHLAYGPYMHHQYGTSIVQQQQSGKHVVAHRLHGNICNDRHFRYTGFSLFISFDIIVDKQPCMRYDLDVSTCIATYYILYLSNQLLSSLYNSKKQEYLYPSRYVM